MNKQDMLKVQTCVLRVNIHCEGCMHKVKKKLQKVEGVYKVSIDAEQGKVIVSGNADPASLIEKLEKAGKHAEFWGPQKGGAAPAPVFISSDQLKKFQIDILNKNGNKNGNGNGNGFAQIPIPQKKGFKEEKFSGKDHKSVRFNLPEDEDDDDDFDDEDDFDEFDEDDEEFDDEFGEGDFDAHNHKPPAKEATGGGGGGGGKQNKAAPKKDKDGKAKKGGGGIDVFLKGMLRKAGRKNGDADKKSKKGEDKKKGDGGGKKGGKKGGFEMGDVKKGKNDDGWSKKGGENFDGGKQHHQKQQQQQQQQGFNEMKANHKGGGGGGGGKNMDMMGQKGGFPAVAGMPAMNGGRFVPENNPYSQQQQYMAHITMMNQQRENGHGPAYHPSAYARPPPPAMSYGGPPPGMGYGPPPGMGYGPPHGMSYGPPAAMSYGAPTEPYTHMFSDENTGSCGIM